MIVTRGLNSNLLVTRGYGAQEVPPVPSESIIAGIQEEHKLPDELLTASLKVVENQDGIKLVCFIKEKDPETFFDPIVKKKEPEVKEVKPIDSEPEVKETKPIEFKPKEEKVIESVIEEPIKPKEVEEVKVEPTKEKLIVAEPLIIEEKEIKKNITSFNVTEKIDCALFKAESYKLVNEEDEELLSILSLVL